MRYMSKALLVMDMQVAVLSRYEQTDALLQHINEAITAAEKAGLPVIYVTVAFREGFPEVSGNNKMFSHLKNMPAFTASNANSLHPDLKVLPNGIQVQKRRVSAFTGSDLEVILRSQQITELVLCGVATSGVVLSTLREAADKDYAITVLHDCCTDSDKEVHEVLVNKVFTRQAAVINSNGWIQTLA
jgi:nicotinamidase-related amidase